MPKKSCGPSWRAIFCQPGWAFRTTRLSMPPILAAGFDVLRKDHNELFRAAKDAEQITEFVLQFQNEKTLQQEGGQVTGQSVETDTTTAKKRTREVELEC